MSYFDFPHTRNYDSDLGWLIQEYNRLSDELAALTVRVTDAEADIVDIKADIVALRAEIAQFKEDINNTIAAFETEIRALFTGLSNRIDAELSAFEAQIEDELATMEEEINVKFAGLQTTVNNTLDNFRTELTTTETELRTELATAVSNMNTALLRGLQEVNDLLTSYKDVVNNTLDMFERKMALNLNEAKAYTDERESYLQNEIDNIQLDPTTRVKVPATWKYDTLQNTFDIEHYFLTCWALRASHFDRLGLTASEYDNLDMIAYDYDYMAKWFMKEKLDVAYMRSPFNGAIERVYTVINEIATNLRDYAFTALEYDNKSLDATAYESYDLTAFNYDYYAKQFIA